MQLATKLVLVFLLCMSLVVAVFSALSVSQVDARVRAEHARHASDLAAMLRSSLHNRPQAISDLQQIITVWSQESRRASVRLVQPGNPDQRFQPTVPSELIVSRTEVVTLRYKADADHERLYTYVPLGDTQEMQLEVAANDDFWADHVSEVLTNSAWALGTVGTVSSIAIMMGGWWLLGRPLQKLVDKVQQIGRGDLSQPIHLRRKDELGKLAVAMNSMCEQLKSQRDRIYEETRQRVDAVEGLRHADRLRTVGRLAAGLAHEIGTPLNVVFGRAELIAGGKLSEPDARHSAEIIKSQCQRITDIVKQLLNFARRGTMRRTHCDLNELVKTNIELMQPLARKQQAELSMVEYHRQAMANVDPGQLQQVLSNLIINAIQAVPKQDGKITISIATREHAEPPNDADAKAGSYWVVQVEDNGGGISPDVIDHLFEPFFTTKDVGEGTGLGLSIAYGIIQEHGGWINVDSHPGGGTTFEIFLPRE